MTAQPKRTPKLKFFAGNLDGTREGGVFAPSQKEAARILGIGLSTFRDFFGEQGAPEQELAPLTMYTRRFQYGPKRDPKWIEGRCP